MSKLKMDAVEVASTIHKGDFSKLRGKSFEMCDNKNMKSKYALSEVCTRLDQIGDDLAKLTKYVIEGFKQVNTRLDYIVEANNLKDLPKSKK